MQVEVEAARPIEVLQCDALVQRRRLLVLAAQLRWGAAGDQHRQPRTRPEQFSDGRRGRQDLSLDARFYQAPGIG